MTPVTLNFWFLVIVGNCSKEIFVEATAGLACAPLSEDDDGRLLAKVTSLFDI